MQPENLRFGGAAATTLHPLVLIAMLIAIALIFALRRQQVIIPFLFILILVPRGQGIELGGAHVFVGRIIILAGVIRLLTLQSSMKASIFAGGLRSLDKVFLAWATFHSLAFVLLYREMGAVVNQVGLLWDALGAFLLLRFLIRDERDIEIAVKTFAVIAGILALCMLNEHYRSFNVFGILGGGTRIVPEVRDGLIRAQGPFAHPLTAGAFGAVLLPLFLWLTISREHRFFGLLGVISSTIVTTLAASSTPLLAYGAGIIALCFWPLRKQMRVLRWGIVLLLVGLNIVMKAPVWFLISHVDVMGGSSSDHRAHLVDLFIRNFSDWWLVGTKDAANWGWDMWDTCNQYVEEGETGGFVAFACFLALIALSFRMIGKARKLVEGSRKKQWHLWFFGAAVFACVTAFFGISFHDQSRIVWYAILAMIPVVTRGIQASAAKQEQEQAALSAAGVSLGSPAPVGTFQNINLRQSESQNVHPTETERGHWLRAELKRDAQKVER